MIINMKVLIDTNVVLDWIMVREPFAKVAKTVMEECLFGNTEAYLSSHTITDLFYILRKDFSVQQRVDLLTLLCDKTEIIAEEKSLLQKALSNQLLRDLEDGLQMQCAKEKNLDFIITRNINDFQTSEIKAILTDDFYHLIKKSTN